jgi:hypothetical protein
LRPVRRTSATIGLLIVLALAGCGGSGGSSGVSATTYVGKVCTAVGGWARDIQSRSGALTATASTGPAAGKAALQGFMSAAVADTGTVVSQLKSAGTPNVSNGSQIASALVNSFNQIKAALAQAASQANVLPTDNAASFATARRALANTVRSSLNGIGSGLSGLKSPDLAQASKKASACTSLGA